MPRDLVAKAFRRVLRYPSLYPDLGAWHASRRDTGAFIGWFCLKYAGKSADVEVGYRLLPEAWGRGFATEGAQALVDFGFDELGLRSDHRRHASGQQGVAARVDEGGSRGCRLGPLLQPADAPLRRRKSGPMSAQVQGSAMIGGITVRGCARAIRPGPARRAGAAGARARQRSRVAGCARGRGVAARALGRVPRPCPAPSRRRARRLSHRRARVLGAGAAGVARGAHSAPGNGDAGRARARPVADRPRSARARSGHRVGRDRARHRPRAAAGCHPRHRRFGRRARSGARECAAACHRQRRVRAGGLVRRRCVDVARCRVRSHREQPAVRRCSGSASGRRRRALRAGSGAHARRRRPRGDRAHRCRRACPACRRRHAGRGTRIRSGGRGARAVRCRGFRGGRRRARSRRRSARRGWTPAI